MTKRPAPPKLKLKEAGFATALSERDDLGSAARGVLLLANRKCPEAQGKNDEPGNEPPEVFGKPIIEYSEPRDHLSEEPTVEALGNPELGAAPLREPAVIEAHIHHLDERIQPGEDAHTTKLEDKVRCANGGGTKGVKYPNDEPEKEGHPKQHRAHMREALGSEPVVPVRNLARGAETGDRWDHETLL